MNIAKKYTMNRINWIDLETTGLDPEKDVILEMALVVTDGDLNELDAWEGLMHVDDLRLSPGAALMHAKSGLLDALAAAKTLHYDGGTPTPVIAIMRANDSMGAPLGGSSPHFDRGFIRRRMPWLHEHLSHRHFDSSTLVQAAQTWGLDLPDPEPAHRAMSDIQRSIELARRFKGLVTT